MKRHIGLFSNGMLFIAILSVGTLSGALDVWAQEKGGSLAEQIQGSWVLVSIYNEQEGSKIEQFGSNPKGFMILTSEGRFMQILMKADLPKFASNNRLKGTTEENKAVVQGSVAYFGRYKVVSENEHKVTLHVEGSTSPNMDGQDLIRFMSVVGDELKSFNPTSTIGGRNYSVWKRAK
jgi:hypothetical protein